MNAYFEDHVGDAGLGLEVLPGVVELLKALQVRGHVWSCRHSPALWSAARLDRQAGSGKPTVNQPA